MLVPFEKCPRAPLGSSLNASYPLQYRPVAPHDSFNSLTSGFRSDRGADFGQLAWLRLYFRCRPG